MQPWPRRADVPAIKPYTLNYPDFCCLAGDEDFFDNNLVKCMFGAVCKNQISEEDFRDKLAELWGANPHIPMHYADWGNGKISYIMAPGPWDVKIPGNWPDFPVYTNTSWGPKYNACKRYHGYQANNWTGVTGTTLALGVTEDQRRFRNKLNTDIGVDNKYDNANKAVTSGLKWELAIGGVVAVTLIAGTIVLIRRT